MNRLAMILFLLLEQGAPGKPSQPPPASPFSPAVADGSAWVVTIKESWELRADQKERQETAAEKAYKANFAAVRVVRIENAYASGIRRELIHYADGAKLVRYLTRGKVLFQSPKTGKAVMEDADDSSSGSVQGIDRLGELAWIAAGNYAGVAKFKGRNCDVYRRTETAPDFSDATKPPRERVLATAYIDRETKRPLALETGGETRFYTMGVPFQPFAIPESLGKLLRTRAEEEATLKRRYEIPQ